MVMGKAGVPRYEWRCLLLENRFNYNLDLHISCHVIAAGSLVYLEMGVCLLEFSVQ